MNGLPYTNWQGNADIRLTHPPRQVRADPELYEYRDHLQGTYPPWFDPAYWNAGVTAPIRPWKQLLQLHRSAKFYVILFAGSLGALATLVAALARGRHLRYSLAMLLPSLAALALYWPVHLEGRYVAPFAAVLWLIPIQGSGSQLARRAMLTAASLLLLFIGFITVSDVWGRRDDPNPHPTVATTLHRLGIAPGDWVANVGRVRGDNFGSSFEAYWAYLADVRIVAEIPEQRHLLCRDEAFTEAVMAQIAALGARAIVTRAIPVAACTAGWQAIPGTDFYVRLLSPHSK